MRYATVLFDLDGTLVDSFELIAESFRHAVRAVRRREATDDEVFARWGEPLRLRLASIAAPEEMADFLAAYTAFYLDHHARLGRLFPGIADMVRRLSALGCRLGVVTSKRRATTERDLRVFDLAPFIAAAVTSDDVTAVKPAADPIREALRRLGGDLSSALMVGDAVIDVRAGAAAGVATAAALWGTRERAAVVEARPDYVVERPADVPPLAAG